MIYAADKITIPLPSQLNIANSIAFCKSLNSTPNAREITFDCAPLSHVEPFTMAYVSRAIHMFLYFRRPYTHFWVRGMNHSYASHMKFFSMAGLVINDPTTRRGNPRYQSITRVDCNALRNHAAALGQHPCDLIEEDAARIAEVLAQSSNSKVFTFLQFTIQEMLRNVVEHSESPDFLYAGQYWPSKDLVEIGIVDSGIGLKTSLEKNPKFSNLTETDALNLALTPGVTSTVYGKGGPKGTWFNTGFGLYMTSRLCGEGGSFLLKSGSFGVIKDSGPSALIEGHIQGTGVRLNLRPSALMKLDGSLEKYREEAEKINAALDPSLLKNSPSTILKRLR